MAQTVKDSFLDLERHRRLLEENIEKLRKSLRHWQTWEAEYEGLKEEILGKQPPPNQEQLIELAQNYEGELVNQKEVNDILGTPPRTPAQIVNLLDRRIDYVEQNALLLQKQIEAAENKLASATIISTPDVRNEEGLPLTEIVEELDEEGNVTSSRLSTHGSAKPQLLEVLQKAGIQNLAESDGSSEPRDTQTLSDSGLESSQTDVEPAKKGVKFSSDTKDGPQPEKSRTAKRVEEIMNMAKQQNTRPSEPPVIPTDESPEDAALRREMLQYGMSEVGAVVAELDFEEGSDWSDGDHDEEEEDESSSEDEYGRSTGRAVDDELRRQMMELEERLGLRMMENVGQKANDYDIVKEGIGRVSINKGEDTAEKPAVKNSSLVDNSDRPATEAKKSVRFSEEIDVSPAPKLPSNLPTKKTAPISDIVERSNPTPADIPKPKKTSRFKLGEAGGNTFGNNTTNRTSPSNPTSALSLQPATPSTPKPFSGPIQYQAPDRTRVTPTGPEGKTLASTIVEREIPLDTSAAPPDELDPNLLHQEVATEYHKVRNRMIQREGGFLKEEENEVIPRTEEEGGPKKMSKFKAARLAKS
jgi:unconventional prefoldin RPB5 interactor 1